MFDEITGIVNHGVGPDNVDFQSVPEIFKTVFEIRAGKKKCITHSGSSLQIEQMAPSVFCCHCKLPFRPKLPMSLT